MLVRRRTESWDRKFLLHHQQGQFTGTTCLPDSGIFIRVLKDRKFFKFTLTIDKEGGLMQSGKSPGIPG